MSNHNPSAVQLSETDRVRIATDVAETFIDTFYTALSGTDKRDIKDFYVPHTAGSTPSRNIPMINYNGDITNDGAEFQMKYEEMPFTYYEVQSVNAHVLNPCMDPKGATTKKEAERNLSIQIQVSGHVRLFERKDGPMRGFADDLVIVPNKEEVTGGKGTGKTGEGRQWLIQMQNFRFVV